MKVTGGIRGHYPVIFIDLLQILEDEVHLRKDPRGLSLLVKHSLRDRAGQHLTYRKGIHKLRRIFRKTDMADLVILAQSDRFGQSLPRLGFIKESGRHQRHLRSQQRHFHLRVSPLKLRSGEDGVRGTPARLHRRATIHHLKRISIQADLNGYSGCHFLWIPVHPLGKRYSQLPTLLLGAVTLPTIRPSYRP